MSNNVNINGATDRTSIKSIQPTTNLRAQQGRQF